MLPPPHRLFFPLLCLGAFPGLCAWGAPKPAPRELSALIVEAMGERVRHDPARVGEALAVPAGRKIAADEDGDGKTDAFYFVDDDPRHRKEFRPLVVKAVPPAGGNFPGGRIDPANVLFSVDWHGDGFLDRIVAHLDDDGDGDIDRQLVASPWHDHYGPLQLVLAEDVGDDNRLWFHRNYWTDTDTYWWRSDFNGDEVFHFFTYEPATKAWVVKGEGPFAFFDNDHDGFCDEIVRRDARTTLRWSFDLDQDANPVHIHDYDFSLTATLGRGELPAAFATGRTRIGQADTTGFLPWEKARAWARETPWQRVMLTWDEWDNNINMQSGAFPRDDGQEPSNERWEGVLNHPALGFPQVGGPSGGISNRRMEVDADNSGQLALYTSPVDRAIHLRGAESGSLRIDFDFDDKLDQEIHTVDTDDDGYFDLWKVDVDGDGAVDLTCNLAVLPAGIAAPREVPRDFKDMAAQHRARRREVIEDQVALITLLRRILQEAEPGFVEDAAERFYRESLGQWMPTLGLGAKMRASLDCERFYTGIIRHRYWHRLLRLAGLGAEQKRKLHEAYWSGDDRRVMALLERAYGTKASPAPAADRQLGVTNPHPVRVWQQPVVVDLKAVFPERKLPVDGVRVWRAEVQLAPLPVPSQCDDLDGDGAADELVFAVDQRPGESSHFRLECAAPPPFPPGVEAVKDASGTTALARTGEMRVDGRGAVVYTGMQAGLRDVERAVLPAAGVHAGGMVADLGPAESLEVVRSGPVRSVLATPDRQLLVLVYAHDAVAELRWSGKQPLPVGLPESGSAQMRGVHGAQVREMWEEDVGVAAWWAGRASTTWDDARHVLSLPGGTRLWLAGRWFGGDRVPVLPARANWTRELDRHALLTQEPLRVEAAAQNSWGNGAVVPLGNTEADRR